MIKTATLVAGVVFSGTLISAGQTTREPRTFFKKQIGLGDDQIAMSDRGKAVAQGASLQDTGGDYLSLEPCT